MRCFYDQACGQVCNDVCVVFGDGPIDDNELWYEAQDTEEECRAISRAFGPGDEVPIGSITFACLEDRNGSQDDLGVNTLIGLL